MSKEGNNKRVLEDGSMTADTTTTYFRRGPPVWWPEDDIALYTASRGQPLTRRSIKAWKKGVIEKSETRPLTITRTRMSDNDDIAKDIDRRIKDASTHAKVFARPGRDDVVSVLTLFEIGRARHVPVAKTSQRLTNEAVDRMLWPTQEQKETAPVVAVYGAPISSERLWFERQNLVSKGSDAASSNLTTHQLGHNKKSVHASIDSEPCSSLATYLTATATSKDTERTLLVRRSEILDTLIDPLFAALHTSWTFDVPTYRRSHKSIGKDTRLIEVESWRIPTNPGSTLREQLASEIQLLTVSETEKMLQDLKQSTESKNTAVGELLMLHIRNPVSSQDEAGQ